MKRFREFRSWLFGDGWGAFFLFIIIALAGGAIHTNAPELAFGREGIANAIRAFSQTMIAVVAIQTVTRTWLWKNAIDAFYKKLNVKDAISNTGLQDFWWFPDVPWKDLFQHCRDVQVVAISANTLFTDVSVALVKEFLKRNDTKLEAILADHTNADLMKSYDELFNQQPGTRKNRVESSARQLRATAEEVGATDRVSIRFTSRLPKYSSYRFGDTYLFVPYLTSTERSPERIPGFCFGPGSFVEEYLKHDLSFVTASAVPKELESALGGQNREASELDPVK